MGKGMAQAKAALKMFAGGGITIWAPQDNNALQHILAAVKEVTVTTEYQVQVRLLIPHDQYPGCRTPESLLDLWKHPAINQKWKDITKEIVFLQQPSRCVFSGNFNPLHHVKAISIVTLSTAGIKLGMKMQDWVPSLIKYGADPAIIIDCEADQEMTTRQALAQCRIPGLYQWEGPIRSLGGSREGKRSQFSGNMGPTIVSELDVRLAVRTLKANDYLSRCLLGRAAFLETPPASSLTLPLPWRSSPSFR